MGEDNGVTAFDKAAARESFIRWQSATRDQFSSVSNLVLGLATGLLAFFAKSSPIPNTTSGCLLALSILPLVLLAASVAIAIFCALNRLSDFRKTAQIARARSSSVPVRSEERSETKILGKMTWHLFWCQLGLFVLGVIVGTFVIILRII